MAVHHRQAAAQDSIAGNRRSDRRYDLQLDVRWKLIRRKRVLDTGTGRSVDLSSGGIQFETDRPLPVGLNVELSLNWPVMLHNVAAMQLVISGRIVRADGNRVGVQMTAHDFRTMATAGDHHRNVTALPTRGSAKLMSSSAPFRRAN